MPVREKRTSFFYHSIDVTSIAENEKKEMWIRKWQTMCNVSNMLAPSLEESVWPAQSEDQVTWNIWPTGCAVKVRINQCWKASSLIKLDSLFFSLQAFKQHKCIIHVGVGCEKECGVFNSISSQWPWQHALTTHLESREIVGEKLDVWLTRPNQQRPCCFFNNFLSSLVLLLAVILNSAGCQAGSLDSSRNINRSHLAVCCE